MEDKKLNDLLERYRMGAASPEDKAFLESWYLKYNQSLSFEMTDEDRINDVDLIYATIQKNQTSPKRIKLWPRITVAAATLLFISFGGYYILHRQKANNIRLVAKTDIAPGQNRATLILANGKKVVLSNEANGQLANEAGVAVNKAKNGELVYTVHAANGAAASQFNTLETVRGEQYQVVLPDGSHVWLNAASSLKYPVAFAGNERLVELTGEAYFEVAHNKAMPFKVKTQQQEIEVLGTHFNINAYDDETAIKTTLLEGSVKIMVHGANNSIQQSIILKPGEQGALNNTGLTVENVDVGDAVAWKNGYFKFNEDIESIMRKLSRWYNIDVVYNTDKDLDLSFGGKISRSKSINSVLNVIEATGNVHFKIEGRRVTVMK